MSHRKYNHLIHPDFKPIAHDIPFSTPLIAASAILLDWALEVTPVPEELCHRSFQVEGYRGLPVPVEVFEPAQATGQLPGLLYIHGGGFGYKAVPSHKRLACTYAIKTQCRVFFPDYHLLPQYPYPAGYRDVLAVYAWLHAHAAAQRIDPAHIAVAGDSAGATLAANLCNTAESCGLPTPCFQMLIYPVTDAGMQTASMIRFTDTPLWNARNNAKMWQLYLQKAGPQAIEMASPMQNPLPRQIPDTYLETAQFDCLHDEGIAYADRLRAAGGKVTVHETTGTIHGYDSIIRSPITKESVSRRVSALKKAFAIR